MKQNPVKKVANQGLLRDRNLALVAQHLFNAAEPVSRADVAKATGMTRATASRLIDELVDAGIVRELAPQPTTRRGRPSVPLAPATHFMALGLEINVGRLAVRLVDLSGTVVSGAQAEGEFTGAKPQDVMASLRPLVAQCIAVLPASATLAGIHLALPGLVDASNNRLLRAPNLKWNNIDIPLLMGMTNLPGLAGVAIHASNEADASAFLAARIAPGKHSNLDTFIYVSGEVGIGSALVRRGQLETGSRGWAGEIGHMCVNSDGPACPCGANGCLERYAGSQALLEHSSSKTLDELLVKLEQHDPHAVYALSNAGRALGIALANAANLLDVSNIVLGGVLGQFAKHLGPFIRSELDRRLLIRPFAEPKLLVLPPDRSSAATGAAYVALERILLDPAAWTTDTTDKEHVSST